MPACFSHVPLDTLPAGVLPVGIKSLRSAHVQPSPSDTFSPSAARRRNAHAYAVRVPLKIRLLFIRNGIMPPPDPNTQRGLRDTINARESERRRRPGGLGRLRIFFCERQPGEGRGGGPVRDVAKRGKPEWTGPLLNLTWPRAGPHPNSKRNRLIYYFSVYLARHWKMFYCYCC